MCCIAGHIRTRPCVPGKNKMVDARAIYMYDQSENVSLDSGLNVVLFFDNIRSKQRGIWPLISAAPCVVLVMPDGEHRGKL